MGSNCFLIKKDIFGVGFRGGKVVILKIISKSKKILSGLDVLSPDGSRSPRQVKMRRGNLDYKSTRNQLNGGATAIAKLVRFC